MKAQTYRYLVVLLVLSLVMTGLFWTRRVQAANFVVNSNGDASDANPGNGVCATSTGVCTLRAAIQEANALPGTDIITFDLGGGGSVTPTSGLPFITSPVIINGATGGTARVQLIGTNAGSAYGLVLGTGSGGSQITSLVIRNFSIDGLVVGSNGNTIRGCYIGTDFYGTVKQANGNDGIRIDGSNNTIGGTTAGAGNFISGNARYGIHIDLSSAQGNQIQGNYIGTDSSGTADLGNGSTGVVVRGPFNTIGGNTDAARNIISGNDAYGIEVNGSAASNTTVQGNYIGTNAAGTTAIGNSLGGLAINDAPFNSIGGTTGTAGNLISGNNSIGLWLTRSGNNVAQGNLIGTDKTGTVALPNGADAGVIIADSANNTIGGTVTGARNVISGNSGYGVLISGSPSTGNKLQGNYIGTDATGTVAIGNGNSGVTVGGSAANNTIGGDDDDDGATDGVVRARNVISGNKVEGVFFTQGSGNNLVQGNYIGTNAAGAAALGNTQNGVKILASPNITVGGLAAGAGNVISGNGNNGVLVDGNGANGIKVQGNYIGTDAAGSAALANGAAGVALLTANNTLGGTIPQARNIISGNGREGVYITAIGNYVQGNYIGTNAAGTAALGNTLDGVKMDGAPSTFVGGTQAGARNVISGNKGSGLMIKGAGASNNIIQGNFIGTNAAGTAKLGNGTFIIDSAVYINGAPNNTVGGVDADDGATDGNVLARNLISGNNGNGVEILGPSATGNRVQGNFVGTDITGTLALGNKNNGVRFANTSNNTLGGTAAGARNVISGGEFGGVIFIFADNNLVQGNFIGTDATGTARLGNQKDGIIVLGLNNTIGGTVPGAGNVISGNGIYGVELQDNGNVVQGNFIGTDVTGTLALGNLNHGVYISSTNNTVGGTGSGAPNVIAFNSGNGIFVPLGNGNRLLSNSIFANGKLGIDLGNVGVTPNDPGDADTGPNNLQNFPVITFASNHTSNGSTNIQGVINSKANTTFTIQFFSSPAPDPTGYGEGQTFRGSTTVTTDAGGNASFNVALPTIPVGHVVTATATAPSNNTSEFSQAVAVDVFTISGRVTNSAGGAGLGSVTITLSGSQSATAQTDSNGNYSFTVQGGGNYTITPSRANFTFNPSSRSFSNLSGNASADFVATAIPTVGLSSSSYNVSEADPSGVASITVNRGGDTSSPLSVDFATSDNSGTVPCQTNNTGIASERCDYATAVGTLRFAAGEQTKTIQIPLINDAYVEPDEAFSITLRNAQGGSIISSAATITIQSDDIQTATTNPIDDQSFFIKQQYIDFLGRIAEPGGFNFWMNRMNGVAGYCAPGETCDRIDTSQRFFQSDEFQERGFYVYRLYDAVLGRLPKYAEFVPDVARLNGPQTVQEQRLGKDAYLLDFMNKQEFRNLYGQYLTLDLLQATDAAGFVNTLCQRSGITPQSKQTLISNLQNGVKDPAHTLEDFILTAEMSGIGTLYYDRGFITMQYFGYLRRDPETAGFNFWVGQLIGGAAPHRQDYRFMVGGFLQSDEYRFRFALISGGP